MSLPRHSLPRPAGHLAEVRVNDPFLLGLLSSVVVGAGTESLDLIFLAIL